MAADPAGTAGLTAVIPTAGKRPELAGAVEAVLRSASSVAADTEVLVVVNGRRSVPALDHIGSPMLRVLFLDEPNVSAARNIAIQAARHDTILLTDDDTLAGPDWCALMRAGLSGKGPSVVAGPVRVRASGPVTALLDYQRPWDSAPDQAGGVRHLVTLNFGIRRDRLPPQVRFDPGLPTGQDLDFGHAALAAGAQLGWVAGAVIWHALSDHFDEIGRRYLRYGNGLADIDLKWHRADANLPFILTTYQRIAGNGSPAFRRFTEFTQPRVRDAFTILDCLMNALLFIGYLHRMSLRLGRALITVDDEHLYPACAQVAEAVLADAGQLTSRDWAGLGPDYRLLGHAADPPPPALDRLRAIFAQYARPAAGPPSAQARPALRSAPPQVPGGEAPAGLRPAGRFTAATADRAWAAWQVLRAAQAVIAPADLERAFRSAGVPFKEGCRQVETRLLTERRIP